MLDRALADNEQPLNYCWIPWRSGRSHTDTSPTSIFFRSAPVPSGHNSVSCEAPS